jgi:hypothetical protein
MEVLYQLSFAAQMTQGPHYARPLRYRFRLRASTSTAAPLMPHRTTTGRHAADDRPDPADRPRLRPLR